MSKEILFIKVIDPAPGDVKYIQQLLANWYNYYKPENYLLTNSELITTHSPGIPDDPPYLAGAPPNPGSPDDSDDCGIEKPE